MSKNIAILEGTTSKVFNNVEKITTNIAGSTGTQDWVPEDEAINYVDMEELSIDANGVYTAAQENCDGFSKVTVNVQPYMGEDTITENGTYKASDVGLDGFTKVTVNVQPQLGEDTITENGTYKAADVGLDGFTKVTVDVQPDMGEDTITENGTYRASDYGLDGFTKVTVDVQPDLGTEYITENGTYNASDEGLDGFCSVEVDIHPNLGTKAIGQNGTYNASDDNLDGYSSVSVNIAGIAAGENVSAIANSNISDGQTVRVYSTGGSAEPIPIPYSTGTIYGGYFWWVSGSTLYKKPLSQIADPSIYEAVRNNVRYNLGFILSALVPGTGKYLLCTLDNPQGASADFAYDTAGELYDSSFNGNIIMLGGGLYAKDASLISAFASITFWNSYYRIIDTTSVFFTSTNTTDYRLNVDIKTMGSWDTVKSYVFPELNDRKATTSIGQYLMVITGQNTTSHDIYLIDKEGNKSLLCTILGDNSSEVYISNVPPSGSYKIVATNKEVFKINADGTYENLNITNGLANSSIFASDSGFVCNGIYYPFYQSGTLYMAPNGSKNVDGQLGICKGNVSAGATGTAVILFS